jgi:hypothetical protein
MKEVIGQKTRLLIKGPETDEQTTLLMKKSNRK